MRNGYHAAVRQLMSPVLPDGHAGFMKAHLCQEKKKELGIEEGECAMPQRYRFFSDASNSTGVT